MIKYKYMFYTLVFIIVLLTIVVLYQLRINQAIEHGKVLEQQRQRRITSTLISYKQSKMDKQMFDESRMDTGRLVLSRVINYINDF